MNATLYLRVSTSEQELGNQEAQLRDWPAREGHRITAVYRDIASGRNDYRDRRGFYELLTEMKKPRRGFGLVVFWAVDRLTREGTLKTLLYLEQFRVLGVKYHSYTEPYISTLGPFADVVISLLGTLAKIEREKISRRTKAGLAKARRRGKVLGRPDTARRKSYSVWMLQQEGLPVREIARKLRIGESSVRRILKATS